MTTQLDRPMKPDELGIVQENALPGVVFNAINKLIAANWTGNAARVLQKDIVTGIIQEWRNQGQPGFYPEISRDDVFDRHYLDFEEAYRAQGWKVKYDRPAYNENYEPFFIFERK